MELDLKNLSPADLMDSVLANVYDVIVNGDGETVPTSEDNFFSWCTPGIPFGQDDLRFLTEGLTGVVKWEPPKKTTNLDGSVTVEEIPEEELKILRAAKTGKLYAAAENFARCVDFIPDASGINNQANRMTIKSDEGTLSEIYERVLQFSQVANTELSEDEKAKLTKYRELLQVEREKVDLITDEKIKVLEESPLVKAYYSKQSAWESAAIEYNKLQKKALLGTDPDAIHDFSMNGSILRNRVNYAMNDWITNGYKNEFEGIAARIDQISGKDLTILKQQYKEALAKAKLTGIVSGSDFYFTSLSPASFYLSSQGWTEFNYSRAEFESYAKEKETSSSTKGRFGFFIFKSGRVNEKEETLSTMDASKFRMSFKICQIPIIRPWFKSSFLNSKSWRFDENNPDTKSDFLSDGNNPPARDALMPAYPSAMIFIKDLYIEMGKDSSLFKELHTSTSKGTGLNLLGLFNLSGGRSSDQTEKETEWDEQRGSVTVYGMQCIGFKCHLLPKSPNPNPNIQNWV